MIHLVYLVKHLQHIVNAVRYMSLDNPAVLQFLIEVLVMFIYTRLKYFLRAEVLQPKRCDLEEPAGTPV